MASERQQIIDRVKALTGKTPDEATIQYVTQHGGPSSVKVEETGGSSFTRGLTDIGLGGLARSLATGNTQSNQWIGDIAHGLFGGRGSAPAKKAAAKPKETPAQQRAAQQSKQKELQAQVASSPWTVMGDYLAQQYNQASQASQGLINPYAGGNNSVYSQEAGAATQNALALTGLGANSPGAAWLGQQQAAAAAVDAPAAQAMGQAAGAYSKAAGPISNAILAYGQANALGEITAPEQSWLNALASHITSNLSYYGAVPTAAVPTFEANPGLGQALSESGGYGGASGVGLTSISALPGVSKNEQDATGGAQNIGTPGAYGAVPTAGATPSS